MVARKIDLFQCQGYGKLKMRKTCCAARKIGHWDLSFRTRKLGSTEHRNIRLLAGTLHNKRFLVVRQKRLRNLPTKTSRVFTTTTQFTFPGWCSVVCKQISGRFCSRNISLKFYINRLIEVLEERLIYFVNVFFWFNLDMHLMAGECSLSRII